MNKIYIVTSSRGYYDDYVTSNEKAFLSKKKAEEYAKQLDKEHITKPDFVTDSFEQDYFRCEEDIPDQPDGLSEEEYDKRDREEICKLMNELGYNLTIEMCNEFEEYLSIKLDEWHPCKIEELELCE